MNKIFDFLGSLKFAGIVLLIMVILSVIGSFVPQGDPSAVAVKLAQIFGGNSERVHSFLKITGFLDIYSSPVFIFLLFLFGLSLLIRTVKLMPFAIKGYSSEKIPALDNSVETELTVEGIDGILKKNGWKIAESQTQEGVFRASKHSLGRWGVIILHFGIIVVMIGALTGYVFGFKAFMVIIEGYSDDVAVLPTGQTIPLGFSVKCDDFNVTYYDNSTRPKSYTSIISIEEAGKTVETAKIDVNHPLKYKDIVFYQTNFGFYPNKDVKAVFSVETGGVIKNFKEGLDKGFKISDKYIAKVVDISPALAVDNDGKIYSSSSEMINPAALIEVYEEDRPVVRAWVLKKYPESGNFSEMGFKFKFEDIWGIQYTGLSVKKDPGTPLIYIGFFFVGLGVLITYLLNYTLIFFKINETGSGNKVCYAVKEQRKRRLLSPASGFVKLFVKGGS